MNTCAIVVSSKCVRAWTLILRDQLLNAGVQTEIYALNDNAEKDQTTPERWERALRISPDGMSSWQAYPALSMDEAERRSGCHVWLDLTNDKGFERSSERVLRPLFNGDPSDVRLVTELWHGSPVLEIELSECHDRRILHQARIAVPDRQLVVRALDSCYAGLLSVCADAIFHVLMGKRLPELQAPKQDHKALRRGHVPWMKIQSGYSAKLTRQFTKPFVRTEDWAVAFRRRCTEDPQRHISNAIDLGDYEILPCPADRFYADPFLIETTHGNFLFFEDYDYRTRRGGISYVQIRDAGLGPVQPALTRPYHLSYPFVFGHEDRFFMIPETSENHTVELYEAVRFPDEWQLRATLLNIRCSDVTLHRDMTSGLWWMFASASQHGSMWDTLTIFYSNSLEGPWKPHAANPVKYDVSSSRPAGPIVRSGSRLLRPAQDCSTGYGASLVWCEILELTPESYREEVIGRTTLANDRYSGPHTFTQSQSFEAIDIKRSRARWQFPAVPLVSARA
jgi:hypothetical protein